LIWSGRSGQCFSVWPASPPPSRHCCVSYGTQAGCTANLDVGQQHRGSRHSLPRLLAAVEAAIQGASPPPAGMGDWLLPASDAHIAAHHVEIEMEANCRQRTGDTRDEKLKSAATFQRALIARYDVAAFAFPCVRLHTWFERGARQTQSSGSASTEAGCHHRRFLVPPSPRLTLRDL